MEPRKLSQNRLARAIRVPPRRINEIIHEKRSITADTAVRLALYFGGSANYWMHLQAEFEIEKVKKNIAIQLNAIKAPDPAQTSHTEFITTAKAKSAQSLKKRIMR